MTYGTAASSCPHPMALLLVTARREIDAHSDEHGVCAADGRAHPGQSIAPVVQ
jgi:hypothetical protein